MVEQDFRHIAQCMQALRMMVNKAAMTEDDFNRMIDRLIWAINASPDGSPAFDGKQHNLFIARCKGEAPL